MISYQTVGTTKCFSKKWERKALDTSVKWSKRLRKSHLIINISLFVLIVGVNLIKYDLKSPCYKEIK